MRNALKRCKSKILSICLKAPIVQKFLKDKRHLPLTREHFEIYNAIHLQCFRALRRFPELVNCSYLNDKIHWLKLFDQDEAIIRCVDKILVREYVEERIGNEYLPKLYQVHDHFSDIRIESLPNEFVIKTNHDSGTVILIRDKSKLDLAATEKVIENSLKKPHGRLNGEWAYSYIEPRILVEEFIDPQNTTPPADYKFFCVEGKVRFCHYIYDRGLDTKEQITDRYGNELAVGLHPLFKRGNAFKRPVVWEEMVLAAERLAQGFKFVRVDLYCSSDRIFAGEMTFWPNAGLFKGEGQKKLGHYLDFDRSTYKPFLVSQLEKRRNRLSISLSS